MLSITHSRAHIRGRLPAAIDEAETTIRSNCRVQNRPTRWIGVNRQQHRGTSLRHATRHVSANVWGTVTLIEPAGMETAVRGWTPHH
eukprot:SAG31_NODE_3823_length_3849_cov_2.562133_5_plen_87_part_00